MTNVGPGDQAAHRLVDDEDGGKGDQAPLEGRREELDLPVAVGVIAIGRATGEQQAAQGEHGGEHVDDGLEGVGEHGGGARHAIGLVLGAQHQRRDHEG